MDIEYVIYCRKSSDESSWKQVQSIPDQIQKCMEYAKKEWLTIMEKPKDFSDFESEQEILKEENHKDIESRRTYQKTKNLFIIKEQRSAKKHWKRTKRNNLIKRIWQWKVQWIISYSPDRQARNMVEWWIIIELADEWNVDLKYATFHFNNNASWRMMLWFRFVFSKQYSDKLSEDITRWNTTTVAKKWKSRWAYKHWYYRDPEDWHYKPHPKYWGLFKKAFQMKLYDQKTDKEIAERLNANWFLREYKSNKSKSHTMNYKRLWEIWKSPFYYWMYIDGQNINDLRDWKKNPFFKPIINEHEHQILLNRYKKNSKYATPQKRQEKYDEITPYNSWIVTTKDWYAMSPYLSWPWRFQKKLTKLKEEKKSATLKDVVKSHQIRCKCSSIHSEYKNFEITYNYIEEAVISLFSNIQITDKEYKEYTNFISNELNKQRRKNIEENSSIQLQINRIKDNKVKYIEKHMHVKNRDSQEEKIYEDSKNQFDIDVDLLRREMVETDIAERDTIKEFEIFVKILQKAPQYFKNATYVQKRKITDLTISNITITADKTIKIKVLPWLEEIFNPTFLSSGHHDFKCKHLLRRTSKG